jgi:hypothetical protein
MTVYDGPNDTFVRTAPTTVGISTWKYFGLVTLKQMRSSFPPNDPTTKGDFLIGPRSADTTNAKTWDNIGISSANATSFTLSMNPMNLNGENLHPLFKKAVKASSPSNPNNLAEMANPVFIRLVNADRTSEVVIMCQMIYLTGGSKLTTNIQLTSYFSGTGPGILPSTQAHDKGAYAIPVVRKKGAPVFNTPYDIFIGQSMNTAALPYCSYTLKENPE